MEASQTQIAIFPSPGIGHLISLIELSRKLLRLHPFSITFIIPHDGSSPQPLESLLQTLPQVNSIFLPPATADRFPKNAKLEDRILISAIRAIPSLCQILSDFRRHTRLSALIVDNFSVTASSAVKELGIPVYLFFLCSGLLLSFCLHLPRLDESCTSQNRDFPEPVMLPGCVPVHQSDLPEPFQLQSQMYERFLNICRKYSSLDGILINSFLDLEPGALNSLQHGRSPPVYPVGPLIRSGSDGEKADCLKWLDEQPVGSVLFVSFGSGGTLSKLQLDELALGLEMSEQRFIFVVRKPNDKAKNAAFFTTFEKKIDPIIYLPGGFIERTKGKGLVLSDWGPQIEILSHPMVGGFLTHCGWNSTLESIVCGVPMIAWPLFAEQKMNAVLLSEGLKVAVRVKEDANGVVDREQVSILAKMLMKGDVGEEIRTRMRILKEAAGKSLTENGSSTKSLVDVAEKWKCTITK